MSFLEKFKLYDNTVPQDAAGDLHIKAEVFDYNNGNYAISEEDGRVDCTIEMVPYAGDNSDEHTNSHNRSTFTRLLDNEQLIIKYLNESPDSPKHLKQKKFISDVKSYFRLWFDQKGINAPEGFSHSDDYRTLRLDGVKYYPTTRQAPIFEILHRNYLNGTPDISQQRIISQIEGDAETRYSKVREFFNTGEESKELYKTFIKTGRRKGSIRINLK